MNEFQQFIDKLNKTGRKHPTQNPSAFPPRQLPKRQLLKFNHRVGIGLLIVLVLIGAGTGLYYHQQNQQASTTVQHPQSKRNNNQKLIQPAKSHHHVSHKTKAKTKPRQKQISQPDPSSVNQNASSMTPQATSPYISSYSVTSPTTTAPNYGSAVIKQRLHNHLRSSRHISKRLNQGSTKHN